MNSGIIPVARIVQEGRRTMSFIARVTIGIWLLAFTMFGVIVVTVLLNS